MSKDKIEPHTQILTLLISYIHEKVYLIQYVTKISDKLFINI